MRRFHSRLSRGTRSARSLAGREFEGTRIFLLFHDCGKTKRPSPYEHFAAGGRLGVALGAGASRETTLSSAILAGDGCDVPCPRFERRRAPGRRHRRSPVTLGEKVETSAAHSARFFETRRRDPSLSRGRRRTPDVRSRLRRSADPDPDPERGTRAVSRRREFSSRPSPRLAAAPRLAASTPTFHPGMTSRRHMQAEDSRDAGRTVFGAFAIAAVPFAARSRREISRSRNRSYAARRSRSSSDSNAVPPAFAGGGGSRGSDPAVLGNGPNGRRRVFSVVVGRHIARTRGERRKSQLAKTRRR